MHQGAVDEGGAVGGGALAADEQGGAAVAVLALLGEDGCPGGSDGAAAVAGEADADAVEDAGFGLVHDLGVAGLRSAARWRSGRAFARACQASSSPQVPSACVTSWIMRLRGATSSVMRRTGRTQVGSRDVVSETGFETRAHFKVSSVLRCRRAWASKDLRLMLLYTHANVKPARIRRPGSPNPRPLPIAMERGDHRQVPWCSPLHRSGGGVGACPADSTWRSRRGFGVMACQRSLRLIEQRLQDGKQSIDGEAFRFQELGDESRMSGSSSTTRTRLAGITAPVDSSRAEPAAGSRTGRRGGCAARPSQNAPGDDRASWSAIRSSRTL